MRRESILQIIGIVLVSPILFMIIVFYLAKYTNIPMPWEDYRTKPAYALKMKNDMERVFKENEALFNDVVLEYTKLPPYTSCGKEDFPEEVLNNPIMFNKIQKILGELKFEHIQSVIDSEESDKILVVFTKEFDPHYETGITYNGLEIDSLSEPYEITKDWYFYFFGGRYVTITLPTDIPDKDVTK